MKYSYARVSTKGQALKGNSLEDQIKKLEVEGCKVVYKEFFTGTKKDRPEFQRALSI